ncbi:MAG: hypothetical protein WBW49_11270, partial [Candidatus Acidiferrum sp.]
AWSTQASIGVATIYASTETDAMHPKNSFNMPDPTSPRKKTGKPGGVTAKPHVRCGPISLR